MALDTHNALGYISIFIKQVNSIIDDKQVYHTSRHYAGVYRSQVLSKTFLKEVLLSHELAS